MCPSILKMESGVPLENGTHILKFHSVTHPDNGNQNLKPHIIKSL